MNRQQRRALERKRQKESNLEHDEPLKKLEGILGRLTTFGNDSGDLVFSWKRENNDNLEIYFSPNNRVGYHISTDSEIVGGGTTADKIIILAEAFKAGTSGLDILQLD